VKGLLDPHSTSTLEYHTAWLFSNAYIQYIRRYRTSLKVISTRTNPEDAPWRDDKSSGFSLPNLTEVIYSNQISIISFMLRYKDLPPSKVMNLGFICPKDTRNPDESGYSELFL